MCLCGIIDDILVNSTDWVSAVNFHWSESVVENVRSHRTEHKEFAEQKISSS